MQLVPIIWSVSKKHHLDRLLDLADDPVIVEPNDQDLSLDDLRFEKGEAALEFADVVPGFLVEGCDRRGCPQHRRDLLARGAAGLDALDHLRVENVAILIDGRRTGDDRQSHGAGRKTALATQLCEAGDNFKAYAVSGHRHEAEIVQGLGSVTGHDIGVTFVPHLVPMLRGIHATLYARLKDTSVDLQEIYERRYREEPFVDVMPQGSHPDTRSVRGANVCRMAWHRPGDGDTVVVLSVEDNLVKGAAGQAVQNMNLALGLPEDSGL